MTWKDVYLRQWTKASGISGLPDMQAAGRTIV